MTVLSLLQAYARRIRELRRAEPNVAETALAPAFQQLLNGLIPLLPLAPRLTVVPEFRNPGVGRPDIALIRQGTPARAFVELKALNKPADPTRWRGDDKRQFERFRELQCWGTCNFAEFRLLYRDDQQGSAAVVPDSALRADRNDGQADREIARHDSAPFLRLIENLCSGAGQEPNARDAEHLASLMAHSARLVRGIVRDRLAELHALAIERHALLDVRQTFRDVLYAHPEAGGYRAADFDSLFSAGFAQTLAFGLLLVREGTGSLVDHDAWRHMPEEHPLMRTALRVLSQDEIVQDIGIGFVVMCDTVNSFAPEILATRNGRDPILYFYEDFLQTFDPEARKSYGVYYTPIEVVRYMVGTLDRALRENLRTDGLRDPDVTILDPAAGTGTFLLGVAERVRAQAKAEAGIAMAALTLQDLAHRMFAFELLVGPYAVAHYRLHHALRTQELSEEDEELEPLELPRLGVYLADTLAEPGAATPLGPLGFVAEGIQEERREANRIKTEHPILAIIGNPPYRRLEEGEDETLVGRWMDDLWDDLKEPVRAADQGNQLNTFPELSIAFWRWAIWKLFEAENAPERGVVAFISNRKFLTGWPYAGLRQMMRQRFNRIEIIDLRGDVRRGERAGVPADQGVFNIMVGTAITIAIADGSKAEGELAEIHYNDTWTHALFSRRAKLDWLLSGAEAGTLTGAVAVDREALDDMRPRPFQNGEWIDLQSCFRFRRSGVQTKRDDFVYAAARDVLAERLATFRQLDNQATRRLFSATAARPWSVARAQPINESLLQLVCYRPLDRRWLYRHEAFIDRPRPELQEVWGDHNVCLYAMPNGTGAGPAAWCHGLLPDYHAFRGSYGGYAFPLYDRRQSRNASNLSPQLVANLSAAYGAPVAAGDVFHAILCLLSAASYTLRFAEDLEDVSPHVPFSTGRETFGDAVRLGHEIRDVETFARQPAERYRRAEFCRVASRPRGNVAPVEYEDSGITLCDDGTGSITGLPLEVWNSPSAGIASCLAGLRVASVYLPI